MALPPPCLCFCATRCGPACLSAALSALPQHPSVAPTRFLRQQALLPASAFHASVSQYPLTHVFPLAVLQEELKQFTKDKLVFFVVATYGEGEPTDNSQEAYKLYKEEEHDPGCMANTNFVVRPRALRLAGPDNNTYAARSRAFVFLGLAGLRPWQQDVRALQLDGQVLGQQAGRARRPPRL